MRRCTMKKDKMHESIDRKVCKPNGASFRWTNKAGDNRSHQRHSCTSGTCAGAFRSVFADSPNRTRGSTWSGRRPFVWLCKKGTLTFPCTLAALLPLPRLTSQLIQSFSFVLPFFSVELFLPAIKLKIFIHLSILLLVVIYSILISETQWNLPEVFLFCMLPPLRNLFSQPQLVELLSSESDIFLKWKN